MNLFAELDRRFAAMLGGTKLPDTPAAPEHSTDSTGVQKGNDDIAQPADWQPWQGPRERTDSPVYPQRGFRIPHASAVQAQMDARNARVLEPMDAALAYGRAVMGRAYADGLYEERRAAKREVRP